VEDLTGDWLSQALGVSITMVTVTEVIWGTATKVRLSVTYEDGETLMTQAICVKGALGDRFDGDLGDQSPYALEARFYSEFAPKLSCGLPRPLFASVDERGQGLIILPDLSLAGGRFGDPCCPLDVDQVAQALEMQARWHAAMWANPSEALDSLPQYSASRAAGEFLLSGAVWDAHFRLDTSPTLPPPLQDRRRVADSFHSLWEFEDRHVKTLVHGDAHVGNTYVHRDGQVSFLDWQGVCAGALSLDVAYFIVGALTVGDRRTNERSLLAHYRRALGAGGGPGLDAEEQWLGYRRHCLHGLLWAVTPAWMQTVERCQAMTERYVAAIEDHVSLDLLLS
jgi:hypothetical protein